jgi:hypothetical protein
MLQFSSFPALSTEIQFLASVLIEKERKENNTILIKQKFQNKWQSNQGCDDQKGKRKKIHRPRFA